MNLQKISGITVLLVLMSGTAFAEPRLTDITSVQVSAGNWVDNTKNKLDNLEAQLNGNDAKSIYENTGFTALRESILSPKSIVDFSSNPDYTSLKVKLLELRQKFDRMGAFTGNWKDWAYDGQTLTDNDLKLINTVENDLKDIRSATRPADSVDIKIKKVFDLITGPEFSATPALTYYKETVGVDLIKGVMYKNAVNKMAKLSGEYRGLVGRIKARSMKPSNSDKEYALKLVREIDEIQMAGIDLKTFKIKLNEKSTVSPEFTLEEIRNQLAGL